MMVEVVEEESIALNNPRFLGEDIFCIQYHAKVCLSDISKRLYGAPLKKNRVRQAHTLVFISHVFVYYNNSNSREYLREAPSGSAGRSFSPSGIVS